MIYIYKLTKNEVPFYIGQTKNTEKRLYMHRRKYGSDVLLEVIDTCCDSDSKKTESFYIEKFKKLGYSLTNITDGGCGRGLSYGEKTKTIAFRVPKSMVEEVKVAVSDYLKEFKEAAKSNHT